MSFINFYVLSGLLIPLLGTTMGAFSVLFMKQRSKIKDSLKPAFNPKLQTAMEWFAGGVMMAASVWSLLIPAIDYTYENKSLGKLSFLPALFGFGLGIIFFVFSDKIIEKRIKNKSSENKDVSIIKKNLMLIFAVTLHNFPEGAAVGVVLAGLISGSASITQASALALAVGIAIQNIPEGAIISMPLYTEGYSKGKSLLYGFLSGVAEPVGALLLMFLATQLSFLLPYMLSFAAGAMIYVVMQELCVKQSENEDSRLGVILFSIGFSIMMVLDVSLG